MARDYYTLQPDLIYLVKGNQNTGRAGQKIEFITRHHLMYTGGVKAVVDQIWNHPTQPRAASAHIVIDPVGGWGQAVWDANTAWANASVWANQRTIAIEHSNNSGRHGGNDFHDLSWNISDETIVSGARVAAAYCLHEKLGTPVYGKNIRDHNEFTSTGCPVHLQGPRPGNAWGGRAGKYHNQWMDEAKWFYDQLDKKLVNPDGTPIKMNFPAPEKGTMMADFDTQTTAMDGTVHTYGQLTRYTDGRVFEIESKVLPRIERKQDEILANQKKILDKLGGGKDV